MSAKIRVTPLRQKNPLTKFIADPSESRRSAFIWLVIGERWACYYGQVDNSFFIKCCNGILWTSFLHLADTPALLPFFQPVLVCTRLINVLSNLLNVIHASYLHISCADIFIRSYYTVWWCSSNWRDIQARPSNPARWLEDIRNTTALYLKRFLVEEQG